MTREKLDACIKARDVLMHRHGDTYAVACYHYEMRLDQFGVISAAKTGRASPEEIARHREYVHALYVPRLKRMGNAIMRLMMKIGPEYRALHGQYW